MGAARRGAALALAALLAGLSAGAQAASGEVAVDAASCPRGVSFEDAGYVVRRARLSTPFGALPWLAPDVHAAGELLAGLQGRPFQRAEVRAMLAALERFSFASLNPEHRITLRFESVAASRCADGALDLEFFVFAPDVLPLAAGTLEGRRLQSTAPERVFGASGGAGHLGIAPQLAYDPAARGTLGVQARYQRAADAGPQPLWDAAAMDATVGTHLREAAFAMSGSRDLAPGRLARLTWQLQGRSSETPGVDAPLKQQAFSALLGAQTRARGDGGRPLRLAALLERGRHDSADASAAAVPMARYDLLRLAIGTTGQRDDQAWAASLGAEGGRLADATRPSWRKAVLDLSHEASLRVGDHRRLTLDTRLGAGVLDHGAALPPGVGFHGGAREEGFLPGDAWQFRANPVIRSLGTNALAGGAAGRRYAAFSLTAAVPVRSVPLVPAEVSADAELRQALDFQLASATSALQAGYEARDPQAQQALLRLADVKAAVAALAQALAPAATAQGGEPRAGFAACSRAIAAVQRRIAAAEKADGDADRYGSLLALLPNDETEDRLGDLQRKCFDLLASALGDAALRDAAPAVADAKAGLQRAIDAIDRPAAARAAAAEMAVARRVMTALLDDINLVAVSPVLMLDAVRFVPVAGPALTRWGLGAGLRFTVVGSVDLNLGWMAALRRAPGEPAGALILGLQFRDLF